MGGEFETVGRCRDCGRLVRRRYMRIDERGDMRHWALRGDPDTLESQPCGGLVRPIPKPEVRLREIFCPECGCVCKKSDYEGRPIYICGKFTCTMRGRFRYVR